MHKIHISSNGIHPLRRGVSHTPYHQMVFIIRAYVIRPYGGIGFSRGDMVHDWPPSATFDCARLVAFGDLPAMWQPV